MPTRYIKESACTSPNLAKLTPEAERCFWRLLTKADDYGRFDADPEVIRGACFPKLPDILVNAEKVSAWLQEMVKANLIRLYRSRGHRWGYFLTWEDHQGQPRAKKSKFPAPPAVARIRKQVQAVAGRRPQMQADAGERGHMPTDVAVVRSSYSYSKSSSFSEVRNGPQPIGFVISEMAQTLKGQT